ncbi:glycosyltransferase family 2 protein [Sedimentibacter hydroxybenzoicus DSM 7310]|uniref:Glycosyltransferase family 2 protein n=1 Tax=Sedimentibacter hydroxybenzoicus DSM 7310 TaxID=1123245 RepID=A0A974BJU8_SEDHY|nr:glycosyltransferase family 2 protein [Sedimentibacter hydroxybenzoicus]NYB74509.1 glycosyltransferase family 2 protein [Sedimentibacter hydroxybenzoicus DSM 7310]
MNLSIIVPHFNSVSSLKVLIDTIPSIDDIEVIIIDDKSDELHLDSLKRFIKRDKHKNIILYNNTTENKGAGTCRNIGLKNAKGKWVIFADSDDYFIEGFYEIITKYFNSEYEAVFFIPTSKDVESGKQSDRHILYKKIMTSYINDKNIKTELDMRFGIVVPWSKLINTKFLKKYNIEFDQVIASNDIMFSTKVGYYMKSFYVDSQIIYCVTKRRGSLTTKIREDIFNTRRDVFIEYYIFLKSNLEEDKFNILELTGNRYLPLALEYKLGVKKVFDTYLVFKRNNIKINISRFIYLNPIELFKKMLKYYRKNIINKRFMTK